MDHSSLSPLWSDRRWGQPSYITKTRLIFLTLISNHTLNGLNRKRVVKHAGKFDSFLVEYWNGGSYLSDHANNRFEDDKSETKTRTKCNAFNKNDQKTSCSLTFKMPYLTYRTLTHRCTVYTNKIINITKLVDYGPDAMLMFINFNFMQNCLELNKWTPTQMSKQRNHHV